MSSVCAFTFYLLCSNRPQVDVFFGPCCDYAAAPVARQARYWNVPMLTAAAMARDFAVNRRGEFAMLTRVGANFNSLALFVVDVLCHFRWKRVMLLYHAQGHGNVVSEPAKRRSLARPTARRQLDGHTYAGCFCNYRTPRLLW